VEKGRTKTIFKKIIDREIPAQIVFENEQLLAFNDSNPQAPVHIVVIPKKEIPKLSEATETDTALLGDMLNAVREIAKAQGIDQSGYRVVINNGEAASQTVFHLHMHILGGRNFSWPPG